MEFVYVSDDSGDEALAVSIYSVFYNNQKHNMVFHILIPTGSKMEHTLDLLKSNNLNYKIYPVEISNYDFVIHPSSHITLTTWLKFSIPEFVNAYKVLYLDIDTIVIKDLSDLFTIDLEAKAIATVAPWPDTLPSYFNAGVILMNLSLLKEKFSLRELKRSYDEFPGDKFSPWIEQNLMNQILMDHNILINKKYNIHPSDLIFTRDCHVLHFYGARKPWEFYLPFGSKFYNFYYKEVYLTLPVVDKSVLNFTLIWILELKNILIKTIVYTLKKLKLNIFIDKILSSINFVKKSGT